MQQTSNWLLRQWHKVTEGEGVASPYNTVDFLTNAANILKKKFTGRDLQDVTNHSCKYEQIFLTIFSHMLQFYVHCGKQICLYYDTALSVALIL
jgi:hypothetical protein